MVTKCGVLLDSRSSYSIKRYTHFLHRALNAEIIEIKAKNRFLAVLHKYLIVPFRLVFSNYELIILPSENYSYLTLFLFGKKSLIVFHDLHDLMNHEIFWGYKCLLKSKLFFCRLSTHVVAVSHHTKLDLQQIWRQSNARVRVIHNPIEEIWLTNSEPIKKFDGLKPGSYILLVGRDVWYKNYKVVYDSIDELKDFQFVRVGDVSEYFSGLNKGILYFNKISDVELKWLYANALLLLFPSIHEGFGWPILEAMASGCPVVASNRSSISEIGGDAIIYFDPYNRQEMMTRIREVAKSASLRDELINKGKIKSLDFSFTIFRRSLEDLINN